MDKHLELIENDISQNEHHNAKSVELFESLKPSPEEQEDINRLSEVFEQLFGTEYLGNYCCYTDEHKQCDDGSDLYTIIKYHGKDLIVKVGAGEFNTKVFTTGNIQELKWFYKSPIPLFVVNQSHSCMYIPNKEEVIMSKKTPKKYLDKCAVIVSPKWGEAYFRSYDQREDEEQIEYSDIHIKHYEDALYAWRLALLHKTFPNGEFDTAVRLLKQFKELDFEKFYKRTYRGEKFFSDDEKKFFWCLRHMWVNTLWSAIGDREAYQSLYELIQSFDVKPHKPTKQYKYAA